jgi:hypothetical protein
MMMLNLLIRPGAYGKMTLMHRTVLARFFKKKLYIYIYIRRYIYIYIIRKKYIYSIC